MAVWMGALLVFLICIDMGVKQYIEDTFKGEEERETRIPRIVLRKVHNKGFLLNVLEKRPEIVRMGSAAAGGFVVLYDIWLFWKNGRFFQKLGMVFVTAGAVSNIYDRMIRGKVVDYIGFKSKHSFLSNITANLADVYVVIGALLTEGSLICARKKTKERKRRKRKETA